MKKTTKKVVEELASAPKVDKNELKVNLIMDRVPSLFDQFPRGSLSREGVVKLVEELDAL